MGCIWPVAFFKGPSHSITHGLFFKCANVWFVKHPYALLSVTLLIHTHQLWTSSALQGWTGFSEPRDIFWVGFPLLQTLHNNPVSTFGSHSKNRKNIKQNPSVNSSVNCTDNHILQRNSAASRNANVSLELKSYGSSPLDPSSLHHSTWFTPPNFTWCPHICKTICKAQND